jgi:hypothetical protein
MLRRQGEAARGLEGVKLKMAGECVKLPPACEPFIPVGWTAGPHFGATESPQGKRILKKARHLM